MSDRLFLNLWFPSFRENEMLPRATAVARHFPFSQQRPGIQFMAVHAVNHAEPLVFQQGFDVGADVERALRLMGEFIHSDYAYEFEVYWDMWVSEEAGQLDTMWRLQPQPVRMTVYGTEFEDQLFQEAGHIQFELGLDSLFLFEGGELDPEGEARIRANIQKLVDFTHTLEKTCGVTGRVLWSENEDGENLAQKLIQRIQKVH